MSTFPLYTFRKKVHRCALWAALALFLGVAFVGMFSMHSQMTLAVRSQCSDGVDNDSNGRTDYPQDSSCMSLDDDNESTTLSGDFVTITDERETVTPGGSLVYIITLKQQRETARNVNVTLTLPHQANITSASDGGSVGSEGVRWTNVSVYKNATRTLTVNVNVKPDALPGQYLVARLHAGGAEATDTTLVQQFVVPRSDKLILFLTDDHEFIAPAQIDTYTLSVRNNGPLTLRTDVNLVLPYNTEFLSASPNSRRSSYTVTWPSITLNPGEFRTFQATVRVNRSPGRSLMRAKAFVGSAIAIDQTIVRTELPPFSINATIAADRILFRKTADRGEAVPGGSIRYTLFVHNTLNHLITDATIMDRFDALYLSLVSADHPGNLTRQTGNRMVWQVPTLAPGESWQTSYILAVAADAPSGIALQNVATLRGSDLRGISLTETVRTNTSGVIQDFPTTGVGMERMLALVLALMALATSGIERKINC